MIRVAELPRDDAGLQHFAAVADLVRADDPLLAAGPADDDASSSNHEGEKRDDPVARAEPGAWYKGWRDSVSTVAAASGS